ncbi:MAG: HD domain-containing protein [Bacilli bacterium]|nr:HD domain-containing protein [Bacilli bacterium]
MLKIDTFESYTKDITNNDHFKKLKNELHHGISRYEHSMRVARWTYKICNLFKFDNTEEVTRAALLHDFYINDDLETNGGPKALVEHPRVALQNSKKYFAINDIQEDVIVHHMFPCNLKLPESKEAFLVSLVDKGVSTFEMLRFKAPLYASIYLLFMFELIKISR